MRRRQKLFTMASNASRTTADAPPNARRSLARQVLVAQEAERARLARDLHDGVGQTLTAVAINLLALKGEAPSAETRRRLDESLELVQLTLAQIRQVSLDLRPAVLDSCGLEPAVRWHLERVAQRTGLSIRLSATALPLRLPGDLELHCFRILQEATTNVVRHARASHLSVTLNRVGRWLKLRVADDGVGFNVPVATLASGSAPSFGLASMRERARLLHGRMSIVSALGRGTTITVSLPLEPSAPPRPAGDGRRRGRRPTARGAE
ncbi:MAG TPA: sensor histidine kinase [Pirellulales bacterium]|nr:sensor histidine kinase [Pirellulales bacterium]